MVCTTVVEKVGFGSILVPEFDDHVWMTIAQRLQSEKTLAAWITFGEEAAGLNAILPSPPCVAHVASLEHGNSWRTSDEGQITGSVSRRQSSKVRTVAEDVDNSLELAIGVARDPFLNSRSGGRPSNRLSVVPWLNMFSRRVDLVSCGPT